MEKETKNKIVKFLKKVILFLIKAIRDNQLLVIAAGTGAALAYYLLSGDCEGTVSIAAVIAGTTGSAITGEPATLENIPEGSEELLRSAIDKKVTQIRPACTPLDQISRLGGARIIDSMKAEYYSVDTKPYADIVTSAVSGGSESDTIKVRNKSMFSPSDTVLLPDIEVTGRDGSTKKGLVLYIAGIDRETMQVIPVNHYISGRTAMPAIAAQSKVIRMGRAAAELDVQTDQYEALPTKEFNYCQIFKTQIEQSVLTRLSNKEVKWSLRDMEESAITDMRMSMEKSFLFGHRAKIENRDKNESIYLTGGVWHQAGKETNYSTLDSDTLIDICHEAFTGNGGSARKVLIGGSGLIAALNKLEHTRTVTGCQSKVVWGIDFTEIITHFGSLYVTMSEIFDQCNHENDGLIIDPEYIVKYSHIPFKAESLDLRKSGVRNTDAVVITEASCLVLKYPTAHTRIVYS